MKTRQRTVCQTCRKRKLGCDGKRPECSQCVFSRLKCDGYPADWKFVQHSAPVSSLPSRRACAQALPPSEIQKKSFKPSLQVYAFSAGSMLPQQHPTQTDAIHISEFIVENYVPKSDRSKRSMLVYHSDYAEPRICGSWVEALPNLPCLSTSTSVLSRAVKALGASITSQLNVGHVDRSDSYQSALHMLRKSFGVDGKTVSFELIPTVMCLTLVELMSPDSTAAITAHVNAVGVLFQAYGPEAFKDGPLHVLFVGFRPLLILQALRSRQPTFLALPVWNTVPFSVFSPSIMQCLLNEAIILTSLLRQTDLLLENLHQGDSFEIDKTLNQLLTLSARLDDWEKNLGFEGCPPYWPCHDLPPEVKESPTYDRHLPLWYPNITMANLFTHLWAFQIVCITEIERLVDSDFGHGKLQSIVAKQFGAKLSEHQEHQEHRKIILARNIYLSMDYLLQDEMELFGPTSTFSPLRVAYRTLNTNGPERLQDIAYIERIVENLARKGLLSARAFIFGD